MTFDRPSDLTRSWKATSGRRRGLSLANDKNSLPPSARRLVGSVNATCPAARSLLPFQQFFMSALDAPLSGCGLLGVINPADKLVPAKWRQTFP